MLKRFLVMLLLVLFTGIIVRGQSADTVIVATSIDDIITLDPGRAFESTNLTVHHATYETLLVTPASDLSKLEPGLAERYELSDDGLVYTFYLNKSATFASGNPVTAEDVRFSWTRLANLKGNPSFYATDAGITAIEAVDDNTVKVTLAKPFPAFASVVTAPAMSIIDSKLAKEHGATDAADADTTDTAKDWLDQNSAGSGPFVLTGWSPNSEVVLARNENYWNGPVALAGVTLRSVSDASTALQLLERGDADIAQGIDADTVQQAQGKDTLKIEIGQSLNLFYLAMSPSADFNLPLSDVRVRQAIAYAIDYDGIITDLLQGYADRPAGPLPLGVVGSNPANRYTRDVEKAKSLLADAGYADGFNLTLYIGQGVTAGVPRETYAAKLQADLAEVGITLEINQQETTNFLTAFRAQELSMVLSTWTPDYLDATMWSDFFSYSDSGISKRVKMDIPEIADLAHQSGDERDPAKRADLYTQYEAAHVAQAVFIPLVQQQYIDVIRSEVQGYVFHPVYFIDFSGMSKS